MEFDQVQKILTVSKSNAWRVKYPLLYPNICDIDVIEIFLIKIVFL